MVQLGNHHPLAPVLRLGMALLWLCGCLGSGWVVEIEHTHGEDHHHEHPWLAHTHEHPAGDHHTPAPTGEPASREDEPAEPHSHFVMIDSPAATLAAARVPSFPCPTDPPAAIAPLQSAAVGSAFDLLRPPQAA